jgi:hypothetical protein
MIFNRWTDRSQPQTLYLVVVLFYINAIFGILGLIGAPVGSNALYAAYFFFGLLQWVGVQSVLDGALSSGGFAAHLANAIPALILVAMVAAQALAGLAIANERKWGYSFAVGLTAVELAGIGVAARYLGAGSVFSLGGLLGVLFVGIMLVLLLHPESREYRRIWFR